MTDFWKEVLAGQPPERALVGRRVRLDVCTDPHTRLEPGLEGTVTSVDDLGTVHVRWDSGSSNLGLVYAAGDRWTVLDEPTNQENP